MSCLFLRQDIRPIPCDLAYGQRIQLLSQAQQHNGASVCMGVLVA